MTTVLRLVAGKGSRHIVYLIAPPTSPICAGFAGLPPLRCNVTSPPLSKSAASVLTEQRRG